MTKTETVQGNLTKHEEAKDRLIKSLPIGSSVSYCEFTRSNKNYEFIKHKGIEIIKHTFGGSGGGATEYSIDYN